MHGAFLNFYKNFDIIFIENMKKEGNENDKDRTL